MNFDKLAELTKKRKKLCEIQAHLTDKTYTLGIVFDGTYSQHLSDLLDAEIAKELKAKAQQFYEEKIQKINKEITKLCQEQ